MDKPAQNIQDSFLNNARKEKGLVTIYLLSGVKLSGPDQELRQVFACARNQQPGAADFQARDFDGRDHCGRCSSTRSHGDNPSEHPPLRAAQAPLPVAAAYRGLDPTISLAQSAEKAILAGFERRSGCRVRGRFGIVSRTCRTGAQRRRGDRRRSVSGPSRSSTPPLCSDTAKFRS